MNAKLARLVLSTSLCAACSGGSSMMVANQPVAYQQGGEETDPKEPVDFTCLLTKPAPVPPSSPTTVEMKVIDFEKETPVEGATIEVYTDIAKVNAKTPDATSTLTNADGKAMITIPAGFERVIFRTTADPKKTIETFEFNRRFDDLERVLVSQATKEVIPALVGILPDESRGVVAGSQRDCNGKETGGVTVELASSGGTFDLDTNTVYFVSLSGTTLPARNQKWTSGNGVFAALNVPPGDVTISTFGVLTPGAKATKLGTGVAPVRPNSITVVELQPL